LAFEEASEAGEWSEEGARLRQAGLEMLHESLEGVEAGERSFFRLLAGMDKTGRLVAFALLDEDNDEHGFELTVLAAEEGKGFATALMAQAALLAGGQEMVVVTEPGAEAFYAAMGLEEHEDWWTWVASDCALAASWLAQSGIGRHEAMPGWQAREVLIG
jgi:GNAT superfamily N-acetyltransferase